MGNWAAGSLVFFVYLALVADLRRGVGVRARHVVWAGSALGAAIAVASVRLPPQGIANTWILPPALLLIGYWTSGLLFVRPAPRAERLLLWLDDRLGVARLASAMPQALAELFELAYAGVYPMIPIALAVTMRTGVAAQRFWAVVLISDYVCFAALPWIQTRPPRSLIDDPPWRSSWRGVNRRIVEASSVGVNTFPSGHAAEALVMVLLAKDAPAPVFLAMVVAGLGVSIGAVLGRYHYAADVCAGWAVALVVFGNFRP